MNYQEPLAGGIACYTDSSGKIEMVGFQNQTQTEFERKLLTELVYEGCKRLDVPCRVEYSDDHECLIISLDYAGGKWGLFAYEKVGVDEDIDGSIRNYPAFEVWSFYRTVNLGQLEESKLTKRPAGACDALRIILRWLYDNHNGSIADIVEAIVQTISPKEGSLPRELEDYTNPVNEDHGEATL